MKLNKIPFIGNIVAAITGIFTKPTRQRQAISTNRAEKADPTTKDRQSTNLVAASILSLVDQLWPALADYSPGLVGQFNTLGEEWFDALDKRYTNAEHALESAGMTVLNRRFRNTLGDEPARAEVHTAEQPPTPTPEAMSLEEVFEFLAARGDGLLDATELAENQALESIQQFRRDLIAQVRNAVQSELDAARLSIRQCHLEEAMKCGGKGLERGVLEATMTGMLGDPTWRAAVIGKLEKLVEEAKKKAADIFEAANARFDAHVAAQMEPVRQAWLNIGQVMDEFVRRGMQTIPQSTQPEGPALPESKPAQSADSEPAEPESDAGTN